MNILTQSIAITDSMFNFGKFLTKNAITFDQKNFGMSEMFYGFPTLREKKDISLA